MDFGPGVKNVCGIVLIEKTAINFSLSRNINQTLISDIIFNEIR